MRIRLGIQPDDYVLTDSLVPQVGDLGEEVLPAVILLKICLEDSMR